MAFPDTCNRRTKVDGAYQPSRWQEIRLCIRLIKLLGFQPRESKNCTPWVAILTRGRALCG
jgi:hypothetical protein